MKKLAKKLLQRDAKSETSSLRITNETVAEHRERILAGGRRFKYPVQYERHKLVFNTIAISLTALVLIVLVGWWQLYLAQNTSTFFYRATTILPLPVASIDGASVRYSDYLMRYRSQKHWLAEKGQIEQGGEEDDQRQLDYIKRAVLDAVEADAYAAKLAREKGIQVTEQEIDQVVERARQAANGAISQELYDASTQETLGYGRDEYRLLIRQSLLREKVSYALDTGAEKTTILLKRRLDKAGPHANFSEIAKLVGRKTQAGASGSVRHGNPDAGLTQAALKLQRGQTSSVIKSTTGDGYYFVRLDQLGDSNLSYSFIKVPLTAFDAMLATVRKDGKVQEYITVAKTETSINQ